MEILSKSLTGDLVTSSNPRPEIPPFEIKEVGRIREVKKGIAYIKGFPSCINGQLIDFGQGVKGLVIGFNEDEVLSLILGDVNRVKLENEVIAVPEVFRIPVGENFIGRVVSALGEPCDDKGEIKATDFYPIFREALGVIERIPVDKPLYTGIRTIDTIIPLARGQRELIVGDRMTGKTTLAIDTILNQKDEDVICIYCCIGRDFFSLERIVELFAEKGTLDYSIVVAAPAICSSNEQYLAPYTACSLGEYFMLNGRDVLVVFDDLTRHAWIYRQLSLLLERFPGREAYPGDMFYLHSQLMERAGRLKPGAGGGSMTFLPIVETQQGDITGYIPSNLVSMTDGQIYLSADLFHGGFKPAIDIGLSVSRIGSKVQAQALREVSRGLRQEYFQYRDLVRMTKMKARVSKEAEKQIKKGEALREFFIQDKHKPVSVVEQIIIFYALSRDILKSLSPEELKRFKDGIYDFFIRNYPQLIEEIEEGEILTADCKKELERGLGEFMKKESQHEEKRVSMGDKG
ncbi:MAG: F0F1 ATP synthase subunit alpha [Candidatus Omnitrophica bacterium 4484_213]|nr:MAG: F0F1 ATP synthase subunit alpha [Candidatus Omnitrophica bacterium 4484_213]